MSGEDKILEVIWEEANKKIQPGLYLYSPVELHHL